MGQNGREDDVDIRRKRTPNLPCHESFCPEECSKAKMVGKLSIHFCTDEGTIETVFRAITSVNQLSIFEAVSDLCEVYKPCHVRTGRPVLVGHSDPLFVPISVMKTPTLLTDDPENEWTSCHNKIVIKFCTDAGFLTVVEIGQYFMTKDTDEFLQFTESVACREYTLPRDEEASEPKGWIQGNAQIGRIGSCNLLPAR